MNDEKYSQLLGLKDFQPQNKYVCFLPFWGEFGWLILSHIRRVHGFQHENKIVCCKSNHESLYPSASHFFYDWIDIPDNQKAGIITMPENIIDEIKSKIKAQINSDDIYFISSSDIDWESKHWFYDKTFTPIPKNNLDINVDIVITPRNRQMDPLRNWSIQHWQSLVDEIMTAGYSIGIIGAKDTSFDLKNVKYKSWDFSLDVDGDLNLIQKCKLTISQETGTRYLIHLCKKPMFFVGQDLHHDLGAHLYKDKNIFFEAVEECVGNPHLMAKKAISFLKNNII
jgi:hypothetical protein